MLTKRRKVDAECRAFNKEWENKYFNGRTNTFLSKLHKTHRFPVVLLSVLFINNFGKLTCLICNVSVAVNKEFSTKRLYNTKHTNFSKFTGQARKKQT